MTEKDFWDKFQLINTIQIIMPKKRKKRKPKRKENLKEEEKELSKLYK